MKRLQLFIPMLLLLSLNVAAQNRQALKKAAIDSLESQYQRCLSQGQYMYGCALEYYRQMDSMLDLVYRQLYSQLDTSRRQRLQVQQVLWKEKKDAYFKLLDIRVEKLHKKTLAGLDDRVISTDHKAAYIKDRVTELISRYPSAG